MIYVFWISGEQGHYEDLTFKQSGWSKIPEVIATLSLYKVETFTNAM